MLMLLSSCAGGNENNVETLPSTDTTKPVVTEDTTAASESESETEEEKILPDIPTSADYGDDEVLFLVWDRAGWAETVRKFRDITADEITGEAINDTVFNRNAFAFFLLGHIVYYNKAAGGATFSPKTRPTSQTTKTRAVLSEESTETSLWRRFSRSISDFDRSS